MRTLVLHTIVGVLATAVVTEACAWTPRKQIDIPPRTSTTAVNMKLFDGITDFMENFDDVVDDFMNKRMGKIGFRRLLSAASMNVHFYGPW